MNIKCGIVSIGSELLEGSVIDTNSIYLGNKLKSAGIDVELICKVKDCLEDIVSILRSMTEKFPLVFTTGGLGLTFDDVTVKSVAEVSGKELEFNKKAFEHIKKLIKEVKLQLSESHKRQAILPLGSKLFENDIGTALGFGVEVGKSSYIISMPGVPLEMKNMFESSILPFVKSYYKLNPLNIEDIYFAAISELEIDSVISDYKIDKDTECIINSENGIVIVKLRSYKEKDIKKISLYLESSLKYNYIGKGNITLSSVLISLLKEKSKKLAIAESCTGGLISKLLTDIAGSSEVFVAGVVSYSNNLKSELLKVKGTTLKNYGSVSRECAKEMCKGVITLTSSDYGISVTGIAGPGGDLSSKPIGLVYICVGSKEKLVIKKFHFIGSREAVRKKSSNNALFMMLTFLRDVNI